MYFILNFGMIVGEDFIPNHGGKLHGIGKITTIFEKYA